MCVCGVGVRGIFPYKGSVAFVSSCKMAWMLLFKDRKHAKITKATPKGHAFVWNISNRVSKNVVVVQTLPSKAGISSQWLCWAKVDDP